jgi:hypothetical protein
MALDNKAHHLCFAYRGARMDPDKFEGLKFMAVQGTSTIDGVQMVRITLQKRNGRRPSTIHKVVEQYNHSSQAAPPIVPICVGGFEQKVICFKLAQPISSNPILMRIEMDKEASSQRYWAWTSSTAEPRKPAAKAPAADKPTDDSALAPIIERLMSEEHRVDASALDIPSICKEVKKRFLDTRGRGMSLPPSPADLEFVRVELGRYLDRERAYMVLPPAKRPADQSNMRALVDASLMDGLVFKDDDAPAARQPRPNDTIVRYLGLMLPLWQHRDTVTVTAGEVVSTLNQRSAGLYRHTCVAAFMQPFVLDGSIRTVDGARFQIDVRRVARLIEGYRRAQE